MSRFRRCVIIVALLAVTLFFHGLLDLGRTPGQDGSTSSGEAAPTQKAAATPDTNPVRVISFSLSDPPGAAGSSAEPHSRVAIPTQGPSPAMTVIPQEKGVVQAEANTSHPLAHAHHPYKWIAAKPMRATSARPQRQFVSGGFF